MTAGGHTRLPRPDSRLCRTYTSPWSLSANSAQAHLTLAPPRTGFDANLTLEPAASRCAGRTPLPGRCPATALRHTSPWFCRGPGSTQISPLVPSAGSEPLCRTHTSPWALSGNSAEAHLTLALPWTGFDANLTLVPSFGSEPRCATVVPERDGLCRLSPNVRFSMSVGPRGAVPRASLAECEPGRHSDAVETADQWASRGPRTG